MTGTIAGLPQFQSGADEPLSFSLVRIRASGSAESDVWRRCADLFGGRQRADGDGGPGGDTVFTFTLNPGGAWVFDLVDQLDHAPGAAENDLTIILGSQIQATDLDGDTVPGGRCRSRSMTTRRLRLPERRPGRLTRTALLKASRTLALATALLAASATFPARP